MSTRSRIIGGVVALVAVFGSVPGGAGAQSVDDARRDVKRIVDRLEKLSDEAASLGDAYEGAVAELEVVQQELASLDSRVSTLEGQIGTLQGAVSELALQTFVDGDQSGGIAALLTASGSVNVTVERQMYVNLATSASTSSIDSLEAVTHDLDRARTERTSKRERVQKAIKSATDRQAAVDAKTAEFVKLKQDAEARLGQAIVDEQRRREAEVERQAAATRPTPQRSAPRSSGTTPSGSGQTGAAAGGTATAAPGETAADPPGDQAPTDPAPTDPNKAPEPDPAPTSPRPRAGSSVPSPSPGASGAVGAAMSQLGVPYKYATAEPGVNFDCSGLTMWAWDQAGVSLPHYSKAQFEMLPKVPADQAQPGDLIFYRTPVGHVAIYIGNGQLIHAPRTGDVVKISTVNWSKVRDGVVGRPG